ncbi:MAG TPA: WhiB family transcriptional regulator [Actinomycetota bacterium]|nr:WhiB family transcriptional regulator [Actinomycetota bacterium]
MFWQTQARCREHDPEIFFAAGSRSERRAKAICGRCPVADQCLAFAIDSGVEFGVWGGLSGSERSTLRRRGRAVPTHLAIGA